MEPKPSSTETTPRYHQIISYFEHIKHLWNQKRKPMYKTLTHHAHHYRFLFRQTTLLPTWTKIKKSLRRARYFFERPQQTQQDIQKTIMQGLDIDILYRLQLLSSVVIATFGLLTNSIPVIIGAMLIAPLLQPIQGIAFAVSTGDMQTYLRSLKYIVLSILFSLGGALVLTLLVPFRDLTSEILARTSPTVLDLGIAFASGIIAFLVIGFKKLSGTIVGAAIAASLLPPLCATGIGLVFLDRDVIRGTFLLFTANLVSIIVAGIGLFYLYGFHAGQKNFVHSKHKQLILTFLTLIIIAIPLWTSMSNISNQRHTVRTIENSLHTTLPMIDPAIEVVGFEHKKNNEHYAIDIQLKVPADIKILTQDKTNISQHLAGQLQNPVDVSIEVIPITSVYVPKEVMPSRQEQIHTFLTTFVRTQDSTLSILDFTYSETQDKEFVILELYAEHPLDIETLRTNIQQKLTQQFPRKKQAPPKDFYVYLKGNLQQKEITDTSSGKILQQELRKHLHVLFPEGNITDFILHNYQENRHTSAAQELHITTTFSTLRDPYRTKQILAKRTDLVEQDLGVKIRLNAYVSYIDKIEQ